MSFCCDHFHFIMENKCEANCIYRPHEEELHPNRNKHVLGPMSKLSTLFKANYRLDQSNSRMLMPFMMPFFSVYQTICSRMLTSLFQNVDYFDKAH